MDCWELVLRYLPVVGVGRRLLCLWTIFRFYRDNSPWLLISVFRVESAQMGKSIHCAFQYNWCGVVIADTDICSSAFTEFCSNRHHHERDSIHKKTVPRNTWAWTAAHGTQLLCSMQSFNVRVLQASMRRRMSLLSPLPRWTCPPLGSFHCETGVRITYNEDSNVIITVTGGASQLRGSEHF